ncbi:hypothetical protein [Burkholderia gladioli]|uniref:hypothetical protein n=1 Tax=Burkholderia gladioli TaxID=28095 RepID=UPI000FD95DE9|nr:hypothetical protein [Burkholderia gladioli]MBU9424477.1 hypothetical protein [Burkholderia gladioli]MDN8061536.1 hypothetical protein [Burkholderia gladioli]QPQ83690.1 hypothetical protein I6H08_00870 [Burkholderia gladioli]
MNDLRNEGVGELRIEMDERYGSVRYTGTRMQLEAEGIIPADYQWPDGYQRFEWAAGGFGFCVGRERPAGAKGPRRAFFDCDNWYLSMWRENECYSDRKIRLLEREIKRLRYFESAAGSRERDAQWRKFYRAQDDKAFQAFKALMPCLAPPPDRRRRRTFGEEVSHD